MEEIKEQKVEKRSLYEAVLEGKLVMALYEDLIKLLQEAKIKITVKEVENTHELLEKARNIMVGLLLSLDKRGEETSETLKSLYWFMFTKIVEANYKKESFPIENVLIILYKLKEGYNFSNNRIKSQTIFKKESPMVSSQC
ncbi:MAG: flagellar protein FliS [bacterium]